MADQQTDIGPLPSGAAGDYLERVVSEGLKRQLDEEENVVRSLPFFATSLGVLVAFIGLARPMFPEFEWTWGIVAIYGLLSLVLLSLALLLFFLWRAVNTRRFLYPMKETALLRYAANLEAYYRGQSASATPVQQDPLLDDLRDAMIRQMAAASARSRVNNLRRM